MPFWVASENYLLRNESWNNFYTNLRCISYRQRETDFFDVHFITAWDFYKYQVELSISGGIEKAPLRCG